MGAPLAPVPGILKAVLRGITDNTAQFKWQNVLHFAASSTPLTNPIAAGVAQGIAQAWLAHMAPACPSPTQLGSVQVTDLTSDSAGEGTYNADFAGTRGDDSIPANAAMLVQYPSPIRYKGGHPRQYLYVLGNADLQGSSEWSTAGTAEVEADWKAFLTACLALSVPGTALTSFGFVRMHGKYLPNSGPPHYYLDNPIYEAIPVSSLVCDVQMASQRRRIGRVKK